MCVGEYSCTDTQRSSTHASATKRAARQQSQLLQHVHINTGLLGATEQRFSRLFSQAGGTAGTSPRSIAHRYGRATRQCAQLTKRKRAYIKNSGVLRFGASTMRESIYAIPSSAARCRACSCTSSCFAAAVRRSITRGSEIITRYRANHFAKPRA